MKNKTIILTSVFIAAVLITIGIGVVTNVNALNSEVPPIPTLTPIETNLREQAYQQLISDANAKIELANQQINALLSVTPEADDDGDTSYVFSAEQAAALAMNIAGVLPAQLPELVIFNDVTAYEAIYGNGNVYIDADSGKILYNGLQTGVAQINADQAVKIASNYLGRSDVVSIDVDSLDGKTVYVIGFSDGTRVYVDTTGQILAIQLPSSNGGDDDSEEEHEEEDVEEMDDD
jgi:hypothetical protein